MSFEGMVLVVHLGLTEVDNKGAKDAAGKKYGLVIADTVLVKPDGDAEVRPL